MLSIQSYLVYSSSRVSGPERLICLTNGDISNIIGDMLKKKARERILDFLLWRPAEQFYEKEIAEAVGLSKSIVNLIMAHLLQEGWVWLEKKGRLNFYQANLNSVKVRGYKKNLTIDRLSRLIEYLTGKAERLVLFGSAALGEDTDASDLDLLIVSEKDLKRKEIQKLLPEGRQAQLLVKTPDEFRELRNKNQVLYSAILQGERLI